MVNVALVAPAATVTLAGAVATAVLLLDSATIAPPEGVALVSVIVPCEELPPITLVGLRVKAERVGALGGGSGACAVNRCVTDQGPATPVELMPRTRHHKRFAGSELVVKCDTAPFWLCLLYTSPSPRDS